MGRVYVDRRIPRALKYIGFCTDAPELNTYARTRASEILNAYESIVVG